MFNDLSCSSTHVRHDVHAGVSYVGSTHLPVSVSDVDSGHVPVGVSAVATFFMPYPVPGTSNAKPPNTDSKLRRKPEADISTPEGNAAIKRTADVMNSNAEFDKGKRQKTTPKVTGSSRPENNVTTGDDSQKLDKKKKQKDRNKSKFQSFRAPSKIPRPNRQSPHSAILSELHSSLEKIYSVPSPRLPTVKRNRKSGIPIPIIKSFPKPEAVNIRIAIADPSLDTRINRQTIPSLSKTSARKSALEKRSNGVDQSTVTARRSAGRQERKIKPPNSYSKLRLKPEAGTSTPEGNAAIKRTADVMNSNAEFDKGKRQKTTPKVMGSSRPENNVTTGDDSQKLDMKKKQKDRNKSKFQSFRAPSKIPRPNRQSPHSAILSELHSSLEKSYSVPSPRLPTVKRNRKSGIPIPIIKSFPKPEAVNIRIAIADPSLDTRINRQTIPSLSKTSARKSALEKRSNGVDQSTVTARRSAGRQERKIKPPNSYSKLRLKPEAGTSTPEGNAAIKRTEDVLKGDADFSKGKRRKPKVTGSSCQEKKVTTSDDSNKSDKKKEQKDLNKSKLQFFRNSSRIPRISRQSPHSASILDIGQKGYMTSPRLQSNKTNGKSRLPIPIKITFLKHEADDIPMARQSGKKGNTDVISATDLPEDMCRSEIRSESENVEECMSCDDTDDTNKQINKTDDEKRNQKRKYDNVCFTENLLRVKRTKAESSTRSRKIPVRFALQKPTQTGSKSSSVKATVPIYPSFGTELINDELCDAEVAFYMEEISEFAPIKTNQTWSTGLSVKAAQIHPSFGTELINDELCDAEVAFYMEERSDMVSRKPTSNLPWPEQNHEHTPEQVAQQNASTSEQLEQFTTEPKENAIHLLRPSSGKDATFQVEVATFPSIAKIGGIDVGNSPSHWKRIPPTARTEVASFPRIAKIGGIEVGNTPSHWKRIPPTITQTEDSSFHSIIKVGHIDVGNSPSHWKRI